MPAARPAPAVPLDTLELPRAENLLGTKHLVQLFNSPDCATGRVRYSLPLIEQTTQRSGEMPRSRSDMLGGHGQHLPLALLPQALCSLYRTTRRHSPPPGLGRSRSCPPEACFPGADSRAEGTPFAISLPGCRPVSSSSDPCALVFSFHTCGRGHGHTAVSVHTSSGRQSGVCVILM